jgi:hypothetical protein
LVFSPGVCSLPKCSWIISRTSDRCNPLLTYFASKSEPMSEADTLAPRNPIFKTEINGCIIDFDVKCRNSSFSSF